MSENSQNKANSIPAVVRGEAALVLAGYDRMRKAIDFGNAASNCFDFEEALAFLCSPVVQDKKGRKGLIASPVYIVDPCQAGVAPLRTASIFSASTGDAAAFLSVLQARVQTLQNLTAGPTTVNPIFDLNNYGAHVTSASNAPQTLTFDAKGLQSMALQMVATGGTASVAVHGSMDNFNTQDITLDTIAAALSTVKQYDNTHLATTVAVNPMLFRFIKVIVGAAGVGFTTTLDIACK